MTTDPAQQAFAEATRHYDAGHLPAAERIYRSLIGHATLTAPSLSRLGLIAALGGNHEHAAQCLRQAIQINPGQLDSYASLSIALDRSGQPSAAQAVLVDLGVALENAGRRAEAAEVFRRLIARNPLHYAAWFNLGHCIVRMGRPIDAAPHLMQALGLAGRRNAELAILVREIDAEAVGKLALGRPQLPPGPVSGPIAAVENALTTLGKIFSDVRCLDLAMRCYQQAVWVAPGYALGHWNRALALLASGNWKEGWREFEWRWQWDLFPESRRSLPAPLWRGQAVEGKRVLVWTEQGYGDAIQFLPLVQRLAALGAEVVVETPFPLRRLFAESLPGMLVIDRPDHPDKLSADIPLDFVIPLMSLPERFGLLPAALPLQTAYLRAPAPDRSLWESRIPRSPRPQVGFVWRGNTHAIPFEVARTVLEVEGIEWHSLQLGSAQRDLAQSGLAQVHDWSAELKDFAVTAAAVERLDLLVAIDTGVVHLAGALGKPVWVLTEYGPNWRWYGQSRSPWYPDTQVFRCDDPHSWKDAVHALVSALEKWKFSWREPAALNR